MSEHEQRQENRSRANTISLNVNTVLTGAVLAFVLGIGGLGWKTFERVITIDTTLRLQMETVNKRLDALEASVRSGAR